MNERIVDNWIQASPSGEHVQIIRIPVLYLWDERGVSCRCSRKMKFCFLRWKTISLFYSFLILLFPSSSSLITSGNLSKLQIHSPASSAPPTSLDLLKRLNPDYKNMFNRTHPLLLIGLPKTGTTSLTSLLLSLGLRVAHQYLNTNYCSNVHFPIPEVTVDHQIKWKQINQKAPVCYVNHFMQYDISQKHDPLKTLFDTNTFVVTQFDTCLDSHSIWPQIDALSFLFKAYPNAFYLHTIRDPVAHTKSILNWNDLGDRMNRTGLFDRFKGQSSASQSVSKAKNIEIFIRNAQKIVRHQIKKYPNYKYLEIDLTMHGSGSGHESSPTMALAEFLHLNVPSTFVLPHNNKGITKKSPTPQSPLQRQSGAARGSTGARAAQG
jgi:hypothetical protein